MQRRSLSDGRQLITAGSNTPLVLNTSCDESQLAELLHSDPKLCGFLEAKDILAPSSKRCIANSIIILILVFSVTCGLALFYDILSKRLLPSESGSIWIFFLSCVAYFLTMLIFPALLHELAHMLFGSVGRSTRLRAGFRITTNLNHVWGWSSPLNVLPVVVGPLCDISFILSGTLWSVLMPSPAAVALICTSFGRFLWQFNFFEPRDARFIISILADKPEGIFGGKSYPTSWTLIIDSVAALIATLGILLIFTGAR